MKPKRIELLSVPVDCVTMNQSLDIVDAMIGGEKPETIVAVNPEKVIKAQNDPILLKSLQGAGLLIPDGIGVIVAARILGLARMDRVPGSELMPAICEAAARKGYRLFLFGASPEVNQRARDILCELYPGIRIVGNRHGYVREDEMPHVIEQINASQAQVLFVALGSPKQEFWMEKYLPQLRVKVCQGVGGTFDVIAGRVKRAPLAFRKMQLEWLYRLAAQPERILRQTALPKFVLQVLRKKVFG
jgi:N-acetylglucosaminyldiphosphoundecaprenol N-acetyl-beta-D-mannosaminyltransferase